MPLASTQEKTDRNLAFLPQLVISEWGLGGGTQDGNGIAASLTDVAGHPFFGLWYPYAARKDPWRNQQYNNYR
jgi:hypothetical protein